MLRLLSSSNLQIHHARGRSMMKTMMGGTLRSCSQSSAEVYRITDTARLVAAVQDLDSSQLISAVLNCNSTNPSRHITKTVLREMGRNNEFLNNDTAKTSVSTLHWLLSKSDSHKHIFNSAVGARVLSVLAAQSEKRMGATQEEVAISPDDQVEVLCNCLKNGLFAFAHETPLAPSIADGDHLSNPPVYGELVWRALNHCSHRYQEKYEDDVAQFVGLLEALNASWCKAMASDTPIGPSKSALLFQSPFLTADVEFFTSITANPGWTSCLTATQMLFGQLEVNKLLAVEVRKLHIRRHSQKQRGKASTASCTRQLSPSDAVQLLCYSTRVLAVMVGQLQHAAGVQTSKILEGIGKIDVPFLVATSLVAVRSCIQLLECRFSEHFSKALFSDQQYDATAESVLSFRFLLSPSDVTALAGVALTLKRVANVSIGQERLQELERHLALAGVKSSPIAAEESGLMAKAQSVLSMLSEATGLSKNPNNASRVAGITVATLLFARLESSSASSSLPAPPTLMLHQAIAELVTIPALIERSMALWGRNPSNIAPNRPENQNQLALPNSLNPSQQAIVVLSLAHTSLPSSPTATKLSLETSTRAIDDFDAAVKRSPSSPTSSNSNHHLRLLSVFNAITIAGHETIASSYDFELLLIKMVSDPSKVKSLLATAEESNANVAQVAKAILHHHRKLSMKGVIGPITHRNVSSEYFAMASSPICHNDANMKTQFLIASLLLAHLSHERLRASASSPSSSSSRGATSTSNELTISLSLLQANIEEVQQRPTTHGAQQLIALSHYLARCSEHMDWVESSRTTEIRPSVRVAFEAAKAALRVVRNSKPPNDHPTWEQGTQAQIVTFSRGEQRQQVEWLLSYLRSTESNSVANPQS